MPSSERQGDMRTIRFYAAGAAGFDQVKIKYPSSKSDSRKSLIINDLLTASTLERDSLKGVWSSNG